MDAGRQEGQRETDTDVMKIREHRGLLSESMQTVQEIRDKAHLVEVLQASLEPFGFHVDPAAVHVDPYVFDARIGCDTHIITIDHYGVWGMAEGPVP